MIDSADGPNGKDPEYLSTLERGLLVLGAFSAERPEMALSDVALAVGLSPAVVRRCLNTLLALGYVTKHGRQFLLRPKVLEFGDAFLSSTNVEQAVTPFLQNLRDKTGDSASMAVRAGEQVMYIAHVSTMRPIRLSAHVGTRFAIHATSLGKAMLAFADPADIEDYLERAKLESYTPNTLTTAAALAKALMRIRKDGFATAFEELDYGLCSVAVPIFARDKKVVAAINCSTATGRVDRNDFQTSRLPLLRETAGQIERSLQRFPHLVRALT